jgi:myosin heavy subunit
VRVGLTLLGMCTRAGTAIDDVDEAASFSALQAALTTVGVDAEQQATLWKTLSALLWLGDVSYAGIDGDDDTSAPSDVEPLQRASALLGIPESERLQKVLCSRSVIGGRGSIYYSPRTPQEARSSTDAMVKTLYERMFAWLVSMCNASISGSKETMAASISVLDIYGFESYDSNTLEQLCINYANEKLQQYFVHNVLAQEQQAYAADGIKCAPVVFTDNQPTVDLISANPLGLFGILDEVCRLPQPSDEKFTEKVHSAHGDNQLLQAPRVSRKCKVSAREGFIIQHFAGSVVYTSAGFVSKNMDKLHDDIERVISSSEVAAWAHRSIEQEVTVGKSRKNKMSRTVVSRFRTQLDELMQCLADTSANYIRCIKPTALQEAGVFQPAYVLKQLRNNGTNEALELMHKGFPTRCPFEKLALRYREQMPEELRLLDSRSLCEALLDAIGVEKDEYAIGVTHVWFKAGKLALMDEVLSSPIADIVTRVRCWLARRRFWKAVVHVKAALRVVRCWRGLRAEKQLAKTVRVMVLINKAMVSRAVQIQQRTSACTVLQAHVRTAICRQGYLRVKASVVGVQSRARCAAQRRRYRRALGSARRLQHAWRVERRRRASQRQLRIKELSSTAIQRLARGWICRCRYRQTLEDKRLAEAAQLTAVVTIQTALRGYTSRCAFKNMLIETKAAKEEAEAEAARVTAEAAAKEEAEAEAARVTAEAAAKEEAEAEAARVTAEAAAKEEAEAEAARVTAEEEVARVAALKAKEAAAEAAHVAVKETVAEDSTAVAAVESSAGAANASITEAAAEEESDSTADFTAFIQRAGGTVARTSASPAVAAAGCSEAPSSLHESRSVEEMLPELEEQMETVQDIVHEVQQAVSQTRIEAIPESIAVDGSKQTTGSEAGRCDELMPMSQTTGSRRLSVCPGRLSIGGDLLLDRLTSNPEIDKEIEDFLAQNVALTTSPGSQTKVSGTSSDTQQPSETTASAAANGAELPSSATRAPLTPRSVNEKPAINDAQPELKPPPIVDVALSRSKITSTAGAVTKLPVRQSSFSSKLPMRRSNSSSTSKTDRRHTSIPKPVPGGGSSSSMIGRRVQTHKGMGTVRFRGATDFSSGEWVGVELDKAGK